MVQGENKTEHKRSTVEHESPTRTFQNVSDKLTTKLNYGTLRDLTELLDPYKGKLSDSPTITLTHLIHCYDRTYKLLQTLELDSYNTIQRITQSARESLNTLFHSTNLQ